MKRALLCITLTVALASVGWAQDVTQPMTLTVETRLTLLESRLARVEADVGRLSSVPLSLARIEEKITALTEKTRGQGDVLQTLGMGTIMSIITGVVAFMLGRKQAVK